MSLLPQVLSLAPVDLDRIRVAATVAYPAECCGLLAGVVEAEGGQWRVTRVVPAGNLLATKQNDRFEIDPITRCALMRYLRGGPERLIGHYHSHPDSLAYPSAVDCTMMFEPELIWVIIAVNNGRAGVVKAYRLDCTTVHRVRIAICPALMDGMRAGQTLPCIP